jgi:hypothetical protein
MFEEVERMHPPPDGRAGGTGNVDNQTRPDGSADLATLRLGGPPILGSSRQLGESQIERRPVATSFPPVPGTVPLAKRPPPRGRTSHIYDPTGPVEPNTPRLSVAPRPGSSRQVGAWRPGVEGFMDPRFSPSVQTSIRTAGMDPLAPRGWIGRGPSDLDPVAPGAPQADP